MGDINAPIGRDGRTRLHQAALDGNLEEVKRLIEAGASVNKKDSQGNTAFFMAYMFSATPKYREIVKYLFNVPGIDTMVYRTHMTKFYFAITKDDVEEVSRLLEAGEDANKIIPEKGTPLYIATTYGNIRVVERLLAEGGIDVNKMTPLYFAAQNGNLPILELLLRAGADVNKTEIGETPLHVASQNGEAEIVHRLVSVDGIDVNKQKIPTGETPLCIAIEYNNPDVVKELLSAPSIDLSIRCGGKTAMELATGKRATDGKREIIELLRSALAWARRRHAVTSWVKKQSIQSGGRCRHTRRRRCHSKRRIF